MGEGGCSPARMRRSSHLRPRLGAAGRRWGRLVLMGDPDASFGRHRDPQQRCARPSTRFPPSNAAAGGLPSPAVGAPALRNEVRCGVSVPHAGGSPPAPSRDVAPRPERFRYAGCCPFTPRAESSSPLRQPLLPVFGAPGRFLGYGAGPQIRCVAGPRFLRGVDCFDYAGLSSPATALMSLRMPRTVHASLERHNKYLLSTPCRTCAPGRFNAPSLPPFTYTQQTAGR